MDKTELLLKSLTEAHGAPGDEGSVRAVMAAHMPTYARLSTDKLGSLIAHVPGKNDRPRVLLGSHMDEVAWVVREVTKDGYLKVYPLGGWWGHVMLSQRCWVHTDKGPILGVFGSTPPHLLPAEKRKNVIEPKELYIDVGATDSFDAKKKLGLRNGLYVTPYSDFQIMANPDLYLAKAFDNRVACALVCDAVNATKPNTQPYSLYGVGSVQEEIGLRGAGTAAWTIDPDVAIIVDVGISRDTPGIDAPGERLGGGVAIDVFDAGMIPNKALVSLVIDTAERNKIPYHLSSMDGGATDAGRVHMSRYGVPSISIGPPSRYIHSHNSIISRKDYNNCLKLIMAVMKQFDQKTVDSLTGLRSGSTGTAARKTPAKKAGRRR